MRKIEIILCWVRTYPASVSVEWWLCNKVTMICVFNLWLFIYYVSDNHDLWDHLIAVDTVLGYYRMNVTKWSHSSRIMETPNVAALLAIELPSVVSPPSLCCGDSNCRFIACNRASFSSLPSFCCGDSKCFNSTLQPQRKHNFSEVVSHLVHDNSPSSTFNTC